MHDNGCFSVPPLRLLLLRLWNQMGWSSRVVFPIIEGRQQSLPHVLRPSGVRRRSADLAGFDMVRLERRIGIKVDRRDHAAVGGDSPCAACSRPSSPDLVLVVAVDHADTQSRPLRSRSLGNSLASLAAHDRGHLGYRRGRHNLPRWVFSYCIARCSSTRFGYPSGALCRRRRPIQRPLLAAAAAFARSDWLGDREMSVR